MRQSSLEVAATWLALGLDTDQAVFYRQSDIPEIPELTWVLSSVTAKGLMNRAHAYKAAVAENEEAGDRDPDKGITIAFEFGEEQVKVRSAQSNGTFGWDQYPRATQGASGVILYQPFDRYHWVPVSAFDNTDEWDAFLELAKKKIAEFKVGR